MKNLFLATAFLLAGFSGICQSYSLSLNGSTGYIEVPDHNAIDLSGNFTIETWIFPTGDGSVAIEGGSIFNKEDSYQLARFSDGTLQFALSADGTGSDWNWINTGLIAPLNLWSHVTLVKTGTTVTVYLNAAGSFTIAGQPATLTANTQNLRIGNRSNSGHYFQGYIDNFRLWNVARSLSEIKYAVFGLDIFHNTSGLVINFPFPSNSGTIAGNAATNVSGLDGTITGGTSWVNSPIQFGANALALDGVYDYVGTNLSLNNLSQFTMEGWINLRSTVGSQSFFGQNDLLEFGLYSTNNINLWSAAGGNLAWTFTSAELPVDTWHHIAVVGNGTQLLLYVDGIQRASTPLATGNYGSSGDRFNIGAGVWTAGGLPMNGLVDEVRVWNVARTQTQLQENMNKEIDPVTATGLLSYYRFNGGIAGGVNTGLRVAIDSKGNNNGTLFNSALSGTSSNLVSQGAITVLPVQWKSFTAARQQSDVLLTWVTAEERQTRDFVVQHSANATDWVSLTTLAAAGNSATDLRYSFVHRQPGAGHHYYRILQRDIDSRQTYSSIQSVRLSTGTGGFKILGNPTRQSIQLQVYQEGIVMLVNGTGQVLHRQRVQPGTITLATNSLSPGAYILRMGEKAEQLLIQ